MEIEEKDYWRRQEDLVYLPTPTKLPSNDVPRHKKGINIPDSNLEPDPDDSDKWWIKSQSTDGIFHTVTAIGKQCSQDHCFAKCTEPPSVGLCSHLYFCNCNDPGLLCKHIHKLHSFLVRARQKKDEPVTEADGDDGDGLPLISINDPVLDDTEPEETFAS